MPTSLTRRIDREVARFQAGRPHIEFDDIPLFVELVLDWGRQEFEESAAILLYLAQDPQWCDNILMQWAGELTMGDRLWQEHGDDADPEWQSLLESMRLGTGPRPDLSRIERGLAISQWLVEVSEPHRSAGPHFMHAWLRWALSHWSAA